MKGKRNFFLGSLTLPFAKDNVPDDNTSRYQETNDDSHYDVSSKEAKTSQTEDAVMKSMMQFFADEMLPVFGVTQKVKFLAPTEQVHVEIRKGLQDFNFVMDDNSITHFEFQSTNGGRHDLRRFRSYEADASYQLGQPVTTYVLFSGNIKKPMSQITEGINTYRVIPIVMRKKNADMILKKLHKKVRTDSALTRGDLVMLPLLPIMGGHLAQKERIRSAFQITSHADKVSKEDVSRIEAAIFAMATKFLNQDDLKEIKEEFRMTIFSEFVEDGRRIGLTEGRRLGRNELFQEQVGKKLKKGNSIPEIADALEQDEDAIRKIVAELAGQQN